MKPAWHSTAQPTSTTFKEKFLSRVRFFCVSQRSRRHPLLFGWVLHPFFDSVKTIIKSCSINPFFAKRKECMTFSLNICYMRTPPCKTCTVNSSELEAFSLFQLVRHPPLFIGWIYWKLLYFCSDSEQAV